MAIKANLIIDQGTDFDATIDVTDFGGVPFDLTGYTISAQMRKNYASSSAFTFNAVQLGSAGQIVLALTSDITADIEPGRYLYDVEMTDQDGKITRVVEGMVTVTPGITRV